MRRIFGKSGTEKHGGGEGAKARAPYSRKQLLRVFRKTRRHVAEDMRDDRPTFDSDWWRMHNESMSDHLNYLMDLDDSCGEEPLRNLCDYEMDYASLDL